MKFAICRRWFIPALTFLSVLSVSPLFAAAGLASPLLGSENWLARLTVFVTSTWGIMFGLGHLLSFILIKLFPEKFNSA